METSDHKMVNVKKEKDEGGAVESFLVEGDYRILLLDKRFYVAQGHAFTDVWRHLQGKSTIGVN